MATISQVQEAVFTSRFRDDTSAGADAAAAAMGRLAKATDETEKKVARAGKTAEQLSRSYDPAVAMAEKLAAVQRRYARDLDAVEAELRAGTLAEQQAATIRATIAARQQADSDRVRQRYRAEAEAIAQAAGEVSRYSVATSAANETIARSAGLLAAANDNARRGFGKVGQIAQQAGYQIQDFAVQVASGQSALTAFAQQAPQLLGIFGPAGALAGVAVVVGAVALKFLGIGDAAKSVVPPIAEAERAARSFRDVMQTLNGVVDTNSTSIADLQQRYQQLAPAMQAVVRLRLTDAIEVAEADLKQLSASIEDQVGSYLGRQTITTASGRIAVGDLFNNRVFRGTELARQPSLAQDPAVARTLELRRLLDEGRIPELVAQLAQGDQASLRLAVQLSETAEKFGETSQEVDRMRAQLALYAGTASDAQRALLDFTGDGDKATRAAAAGAREMARETGRLQEALEAASQVLSDYADLRLSAGERAARPFLAAEERIQDVLARGKLAAEDAARAQETLNRLRETAAQVSASATQAYVREKDAALAALRPDDLLSEMAALKQGAGALEEWQRQQEIKRGALDYERSVRDAMARGYRDPLSDADLAAEVEQRRQLLDLLGRQRLETEQYQRSQQALREVLVSGFQDIGDTIVESALKGGNAWEALGNVFGNVAQRIASMAIQLSIINPLLNNMFGLTGGNALATMGGNSLFGSLFGVGGNAFTPAPATPGFASGGYTGHGPRDAVAGVVHRGEFVWDADTTARFRPLLAAMQDGRTPALPAVERATPAVSMPVKVNVINNGGSENQVSAQTRMGGGGMPEIDVYIDRRVDGRMNRNIASGRSDRALGQRYGAMPQVGRVD